MFFKSVLIISTLSYISSQTVITEEEERETVMSSVDAVLSRTAALPCDIEPDIREDRVYMVLWYRDGYSKPIYSFDVRGRAFSKALHWSDTKMFGPRAYFVTVSKPAALTLDGVQLDDEGVYRCRVDFRTTRTRNFAINLTVIVPPHHLLLYDNSGRNVSGSVGPLEEGSDLVLTCEVRGGRPFPTVSWFINDRIVEGKQDAIGNNVIVNKLEINGLTRELLNSTYKCQASNTKLMMPTEKIVHLELLLRPLRVLITTKPEELVANENISIRCEVIGSRPKPLISWVRDNRAFRRGKIIEEGINSTVTSTITFVPVPEDDNSILKCVAENPKLNGVMLEDSFKLNVVYSPQVVLVLGNTLNPDDIKEGDDVYFECHIKSNPKEYKILWYHDEVLVGQNMSSGIIISTNSLVLQKVSKWQSGYYICLTVNARGETASDPVLLRVRYTPVCSTDNEITIIGASLDEELKVRCQVSADPTEVIFVWQFNNSGESFDVSPQLASSNGNISELTYAPTSQRDYGTLICWGKNSIGKQMEPCIFQIVPAAKPNPLSNCTLRGASNQTEIVEVECRAGYDGGLPQHFVLEAYDVHNMQLKLNFTVFSTDNPTFRFDLGQLLPFPSSLRIFVYAENAKGCSEKLVLDDILFNDAEKRTDGSNNESLLPLAGLLTGSLLTLGMAILIIVVIAIRRKQKCDCSHHLNLEASMQNLKSRQSSMLEINTGDNRYVVAYTLKLAADCNHALLPPPAFISQTYPRRQPDILNTPKSADDFLTGFQGTEALITCLDAHNENMHHCDSTTQFANLLSSSTSDLSGTLRRLQSRDLSDSAFGPMRRDHLIADSIPGPESCV